MGTKIDLIIPAYKATKTIGQALASVAIQNIVKDIKVTVIVDGDGLNDDFKVINPPDNIVSFAMYIYNRWGQKVFETKDVLFGWDGMIKGAGAPAGTYVFRVEYSISNRSFDASGTVVLVR